MATSRDGLLLPPEPVPLQDAEHQLLTTVPIETKQPSSDSHKGRSEKAGPSDQERAVGISAFASPDVTGFKCTVKHRYTDFLVNEILPNGQVLHLTNTGVIKKRGQQREQGVEIGLDENVAANVGGSAGAGNDGDGVPTKRRSPEPSETPVEDISTPRKRQRTEHEQRTDSQPPIANEKLVGSGTQETSTNSSKKDRKDEIIASVQEADKSVIQDLFGDATAKQILNLYANVVLYPERKPRDHPVVTSEQITEKAKRTEAHVAVRRIFASKLETLTMQDQPGIMSIKAAPAKGPSGARGQTNGENSAGPIQKGKLGWEQLGGEYLHFTLYKENKDTMEVLFFLASRIKVPIKNFQFAGTKDRRGVTVQRVAIFRVRADQIAQLNRFARGWRLGGFEYKKHGLDLGELGGNEFLLTLRDCRFQDDESLSHQERLSFTHDLVTAAAESFTRNGFLNHYGLQRFGTFSTGTHVTGQKMLKGDLEGAVDSILTYSDDMLPEKQDPTSVKKVPQDDIDRADAIRTWRTTGQSSQTVSKMPRRFQGEAAIIQHLSKKDRKTGKLLQDRDWQGALMQIQRNLRLIYVHAYQSFVWNTLASKRWELYGARVVEGDLVIVGEKDGDGATSKDDVDEDGEPIFHPAADDSAPTAEDAFTRARHLSKTEAENGRYNIFDIVLPQPGYDVLYPDNAVGKFYEEFMASEAGGGLDPHSMKRPWKEVSLPGSYRKVMARPGKDFGFEIKSYGRDEEQMAETDLELVEKMNDRTVEAGAEIKPDPMEMTEEQDAERKIAIVLKLQLGSSQYATIALRELTKGGAVNYKPEYSAR